MTTIHFYRTQETLQDLIFRFVSHLVEKDFLNGMRIYIHTDNEHDAQKMDTLLWTFRDVSFVPHYLVSANKEAPVLIGFGQVPNIKKEVLINLSSMVPPFFDQFDRVVEVVSEEPTQKSKSREHYKQYKGRGFEMVVYD